MERSSPGQERDGVLRLLSLELTFADEPCAEALSDARLLSGMARFEGALALASARTGLVPLPEAKIIAEVCARATFDPAELARSARAAGALAIPFVNKLTQQVAATSQTAARYVHFGATSQDVLDTAVVLCLRPAATRITDLSRRVGNALARIVRAHLATPIAARTLLQPALPVPFGWKVATWLSLLSHAHRHFAEDAAEACVLQFGGAGGTLSAFGQHGIAVRDALAGELGLRPPGITWHSARDGFARLGASAAILTGAAARVARDVSLLMQAEVAEVSEPAASGRGGSSSLPHKRNPAGCLLALEAVQRSPGLAATLLGQLAPEHERGLGHWQSQWLTLRTLLGGTASALAAMVEVTEDLMIDPAAMQANLERSLGLVYSEAVSVRLSAKLGKAKAHAAIERLSASAIACQKNLYQVMCEDPDLRQWIAQEELASLFQPEHGFGSAAAMAQTVLDEWDRVGAATAT